MKKALWLIAIAQLASISAWAMTEAIDVSQGEKVRLTLKLVNVGNTPLAGVNAQLDPQSTPVWLQVEGTQRYKSVDVPAKSGVEKRPHAMLPLTFAVDRQAPEGVEVHIRVLIREDGGKVWTENIPLKILPRPKPKSSQVLQNYPNPFNPETWIPYQLDRSTHVKLSIYEPSGRLVRTLDLGHKLAGFYTSRASAAYWDGRNDFGERVSSGLYFYQLQTDRFSAMRRMLIVK